MASLTLTASSAGFKPQVWRLCIVPIQVIEYVSKRALRHAVMERLEKLHTAQPEIDIRLQAL